MKSSWTIDVGGRPLNVRYGTMAQQANGAVFVQYGETAVLATAVMDPSFREGDVSFFPLRVDYEERFYAAGKIKGSRWIKREGRPSDEATLNARIIDRTIRPLFDPAIRNQIQIVVTVLSYDGVSDPIIPALFGASLALSISDIPWNGPIAGLVMEERNDKWLVNPPAEEQPQPVDAEERAVLPRLEERPLITLKTSKILVSARADAIVMIESDVREIPEETLLKGFAQAHQLIQPLVALQAQIVKELDGREKSVPHRIKPSPAFQRAVDTFTGTRLPELPKAASKQAYRETLARIHQDLHDHASAEFSAEPFRRAVTDLAFESVMDRFIHRLALEENRRVDGRAFEEIRPLSIDVGLLPKTHGSALFTRGETQALSIATLGAPGMEQWFDEMELAGRKRYIHHYNFPPYSTGEVKMMRGAGRREIGHGSLAEKALQPVIPDEQAFPYTIRVVSEILSSNGSSSMASVCGSSLALMDAGVPITAPVAGIAMGVLANDDNSTYRILTDIQGPEDHHGDMDLKVAGTRRGVTAIQLDIKMHGVSMDILRDGLAQARSARLHILDAMERVIAAPRPELSPEAPRVEIITVNPDRIRDIIGPGGKMIHAITAATGAQIDIEDDGRVFITTKDRAGMERAAQWIKDLTREVEVGEIFTGPVKSITDFGAFIEILPDRDALLHISEMAPHRIESARDILSEGDRVVVRVKKVDKESGKIGLTMEGLEQQDLHPSPQKAGDRGPRRENHRFRDRGGRQERRRY